MAEVNQSSNIAAARITPAPPLKDDLLCGVKSIADFIGESERRTYYLCEKGLLPGAFRMGRRWCARGSTLVENIRRLEQGAA